MKAWINKKTVGGFFLGFMVLLIFFSKTIYTYNLPEVTAAKPVKGQLSKVEVGHGTVRWARMDSIYIPEGGTIGEIYVREGEQVTAGQKLFSMIYDSDENERALQEIENSRNRIQLEIENLLTQIEAAKLPDAELLNTRQQLAEAEFILNACNVLYSEGGVSLQELQKAGHEAGYLRLKCENMKREAGEREEMLKRELETKRLDLEQLILTEEPLLESQRNYNTHQILTAPSDGMLMICHVAEGRKVDKDVLAAEIGTGGEYILTCPVALENNFIAPGDSCNLSNASHQIKGVVTSVLPGEQEKLVSIRFTAENVAAGETLEVLFQKTGETIYNLVPNEAVNKDKDGYYLKQLKRRDGVMGKEYYLDRISIHIGDSDSRNTAVIQGVTFFEPVMLSGSKKAEPGDVVLLKNAGDFFEE